MLKAQFRSAVPSRNGHLGFLTYCVSNVLLAFVSKPKFWKLGSKKIDINFIDENIKIKDKKTFDLTLLCLFGCKSKINVTSCFQTVYQASYLKYAFV